MDGCSVTAVLQEEPLRRDPSGNESADGTALDEATPLLLVGNTVAQSTTEAVRSNSSASSPSSYFVHVRGHNPRRCAGLGIVPDT